MVILEKGLSFSLPKKLIGKTIKQIEIVPSLRYFEAIKEVKIIRLKQPFHQVIR
jgi:hypothetical protein